LGPGTLEDIIPSETQDLSG